MDVAIIGPVLFVVAFAFFVAGYIIGKRKGSSFAKHLCLLQQAERDMILLGNAYLEIRRLDPTKVRIDGSKVPYGKTPRKKK